MPGYSIRHIEPLLPTGVAVDDTFLHIAQYDAEDWFWEGESTQDYQNESTLDVTPQFFAPAAPSLPIEVIAAQPHYGEWDWSPSEEELWDSRGVGQYVGPVFYPPDEVFVATQPIYGEWFWEALDTEDYQEDTPLDVTPQLFPLVVVEPIETFAAQLLQDDYWFEPEPFLPDEDTEQLEFLAPPEVRIPELLAAQGEFPAWTADEAVTEDYQTEVDALPPFLFPTAQEAIEVFAAQPEFPAWLWEAEETQDYPSDVDISAFLAPVLEPVETFASQPHYGEWFWPETETEDYGHDLLGVEAFVQAPLTVAEIIGAIDLPDQQELWPELLPYFDPWDDGLAVYFPPPLFVGEPVCGPDAVETALGATLTESALIGNVAEEGLQGEALEIGVGGVAVLVADQGTAKEVC